MVLVNLYFAQTGGARAGVLRQRREYDREQIKSGPPQQHLTDRLEKLWWLASNGERGFSEL
jgi:hypothetical protein